MTVSDPYVPTERHPDPNTINFGGDPLVGTGAPANSLGSNGNLYVASDTGAVYSKSGGVWTVLSGGSGSGIGEVLHGAFATPVGNVTPTTTSKSAIYSQDGAANNNLWRWDVPEQTWYQIIGP